jgi:hypothetical protein
MKTRSEVQREPKTQSAATAQREAAGGAWSAQLMQSQRQSQQAAQLQTLQRAAPEEELLQGKALQRAAPEEELLQGKALQRAAPEEELLQGKALQRVGPEEEEPIQGKAEDGGGGLPAGLRSGVEAMSGMDLSDVQVHRDSDRPAQVNALAYAQGNEVHLGPGQEQHLPHEAWHVVQQRQGRVQPTMQMAGTAINDDAALESEADQMGAQALKLGER